MLLHESLNQFVDHPFGLDELDVVVPCESGVENEGREVRVWT